uniref:hypothetical protein n=1 Tax=Legionella tunisiensis TaxID=1034944 RepID=UPI0038BCB3A8
MNQQKARSQPFLAQSRKLHLNPNLLFTRKNQFTHRSEKALKRCVEKFRKQNLLLYMPPKKLEFRTNSC